MFENWAITEEDCNSASDSAAPAFQENNILHDYRQ